jgi:hypothetical protein
MVQSSRCTFSSLREVLFSGVLYGADFVGGFHHLHESFKYLCVSQKMSYNVTFDHKLTMLAGKPQSYDELQTIFNFRLY